MPSVHVERISTIARTPRVIQVESMFDVPPSEQSKLTWDVEMPLDECPWQVGLIVGPSGCGKSTIAREVFGDRLIERFDWPTDKGIIDAFPEELDTKTITSLLSTVGLASPPAWVRPHHVLSNGEQFRATVARAIAEAEDLVAIDEFTSVVDRQVAKVASHAIQKAIRKTDKQFVAVTCHYDVIDWLQPDWIYEPAGLAFTWRCLQRRPALDLEVYPCGREVWRTFAPHHYLSSSLPNGSYCHVGYVGDDPVAWLSWRRFPHPRRKNIYYINRVVVLPDYQGLGIATVMLDWAGQTLADQGQRAHITTAHPGLVRALARSPRWEMVTKQGFNTMTWGKKGTYGQQTAARRRKKGTTQKWMPTKGSKRTLADGTLVDLRRAAVTSFRYRPPKADDA